MARANLSGETRSGTATADQREEIAGKTKGSPAFTGSVRRGDRVAVRSNAWEGERTGEVVGQVIAGAADVLVRLSPSEDRQLIADNGGNATLTVQSVSLVRGLDPGDERLATSESTARICLAELRPEAAGVRDAGGGGDSRAVEMVQAVDKQLGAVSDRLDQLAGVLHNENDGVLVRMKFAEALSGIVTDLSKRLVSLEKRVEDLAGGKSGSEEKTTAAAAAGKGGGKQN